MTKDKAFPAMYWPATGGAPQVFNSADEIPEGWLPHHPSAQEPIKEAPVVNANKLPMTKAAIIAALAEGGITAPATASTKALYDLLVTSLQDELTESKIEFPVGATAPELLALVPKSE